MISRSHSSDMLRPRRLRVLVIACECSPSKSQVAGSSWKILTRLSAWNDLWVITSERFREEIQAQCSAEELAEAGILFFYVDERWAPRKNHSRSPVPVESTLAYRRWLSKTYRLARELHGCVHFDLVHHLRRNTFRLPGHLWRLPVPFVWGPTGGTNGVPWCLMASLDWKNRILHGLRNVLTAAQLHLSPTVRRAAKEAEVLIAQTSHDQRRFAAVLGVQSALIHEQATDPEHAVLHRYDGSRPLRTVVVGRLVASKGVPIALQAIAAGSVRGKVQLHIVGDGPLGAEYKGLARRLGVDGDCRWHGWVPSDRVLAVMKDCDVLLFPSLLEATSTTVMQALSAGLPVIALRHCGYSDILDKTCAIMVDVGPREDVVRGFRRAIRSLLAFPHKVEALSEGACRKAREHSWDVVARKIHQAYLRAAEHTDQPVNGGRHPSWGREAGRANRIYEEPSPAWRTRGDST